jgi:hypothetical protein
MLFAFIIRLYCCVSVVVFRPNKEQTTKRNYDVQMLYRTSGHQRTRTKIISVNRGRDKRRDSRLLNNILD